MDHRNYLKLFLNKISPDEYNSFDNLSLIRSSYLSRVSKPDAPRETLHEFFEDFITNGDKSLALRKERARCIVELLLNPEKDFTSLTPAEIKEESLKTLDDWIGNITSIKRNIADCKEEKEDVCASTDDSIKLSMTSAILSEIDPATIAPAIADVQFNRRNKLLALWNRCENDLEKLRADKMLMEKFNFAKYIAIDAQNIEYGVDMISETYRDEFTGEQLKLHAHPIKCLLASRDSCALQLLLSNESYMKLFKNSCRDLARRDKTLLIFADNQYNAGHNADMGHDSAITPLYYTSTTHLALSRLLFLYPMKHTTNILIPYVMTFLDSENEYKKIDKPYIGSVLLYAPNFNSTLEPLEVKFRKQIYNALCIAANLQYEYVIINNGSARDNLLAEQTTVRIIREVAEQNFAARLRSVIIAQAE